MESEYKADDIDIEELKPWNHLELAENKVKVKEIEPKPACNKFDKVIETLASFESAMNIE